MVLPLLAFLIVFPLIIAIILRIISAEGARKPIVIGSAVIIAAASIWLAVLQLAEPWTGFVLPHDAVAVIDIVALCISIALAAIIIAFAVKYRNMLALVLAIVQVAGAVYFDLACAHGAEVFQPLYVDSLSVIMALIIGIVGSGICVYALGYMSDFQAHEPEGARDRRPTFFALMFLFLSAMYVIVFSNHMSWMFIGWEITTTCSFLLIAFTRTDEAIRNAFRQIIMSLLGGIGFLAALFVAVLVLGTLSLDEFIAIGVASAGVAPPVLVFAVGALAFAGLTKAAQMPFHTWLLGAMVAPTPTSALLHSSTMVKAGVFLLVKLAPLFVMPSFEVPRAMILLVGGITFMLCSFMAISQSNAKRVLAYSTIANLGLITACAGLGSAASIWAAILLIVFHAATKSLLFLCVGTAEHHIGSRNIEDMDLLFERMPRLARFMMLGIMCMFIAPFGMLTAKWATLVSFAADGNVVLILLLVFGSAATFMFWAKWLGKLSGVAGSPENIERTVHPSEWSSLWLMAILTAVSCILLPLASQLVVVPAIESVFASFGSMESIWIQASSFGIIDSDDLWIAAILAIVVIVVLTGSSRASKKRTASVYLSGVSIDSDTRTFRNSLNGETAATARNLYLEPYFGEKRFTRIGTIACAVIIVAALIASGVGPLTFV